MIISSLLLWVATSGNSILPAVSDPARQLTQPGNRLRIMWYNTENLFHPDNDTIQGDDEFTPEGVRYWTRDRFERKLTALAKVIIAAGAWDPPDLVGLCEVEDARILEILVQHPILAPYGYRFVHRDSPDHRGMDVACLYREKRIRLSSWRISESEVRMSDEGTRDLLHFCGVWGDHDTLDLLLVHFISKYRGAGATADPRRRQAAQLAHLADSVSRVRVTGLTVLAGDFNAEMGEYSMEPLGRVVMAGDTLRPVHLEGPGSYKYKGTWSTIDQFLVCGQLRRYRIEGTILCLPVLLTRDETYGGEKPHRTYEGYNYAGGISDHLPVVLDITLRPFSARSGR